MKASLGLSDDSFQILESRGRNRDEIRKKMEPKDGKIGQGFIDAYWDGQLFGNTFLEEGGTDTIRAGVAHFGVGVSIAPIDIEFSTWTSKFGVETGKDRGMAPMAFRVVKHGLYAVPFFVNPNAAHKTGCTKQGLDLMLHLLKHTYASTRSVAKKETMQHPLLEQNLRIGQMPFIQARVLARHLRGDLLEYLPLIPK